MGAVSCCRLTGARDQSSGAFRAVAIQIVLGVLPMLAGTSEPSVHPAPSTTPPPAFRHPANASLCFAPMFKGLQAGNLLRLSGAKLCRRRCFVRAGALLRVCRLVVQQRHNAVLVLRFWLLPRPGLQRGCRRDSPSCCTRS